MFKKLAIAFAIVIIAFLGYAATRPDTFHIERSAMIAAPPQTIFAILDDFHRWGEWSPWEKLDPAMKKEFEGAERGKGAVYAWKGNDDVGQGRMEILEATPPSHIEIQLDFLTPFEAHNITTFTITPQGPQSEASTVTWAMRGENNYMAKVMSVFMDMDSLIGKDFEAGLENLEALAEKETRPAL